MAAISFSVKGKNYPAPIYVRVVLDRRQGDFMRKTGFSVMEKQWNPKNGVKASTPELKNLKASLKKMEVYIGGKLNEATEQKKRIDGLWLQQTIDSYNGKGEADTGIYLTDYIDRYTRALSVKPRRNGEVGMSEGTKKKTRTVKQKILDYEAYTNTRYLVKDVGRQFGEDFSAYLSNVQKLGVNTIGVYVKYVKTVCRDAFGNGHEVAPTVEKIQGFREKTEKIVLSFDEIDQIEAAQMDSEYKENARDWLVIGCNLGQRVSDLLRLTKNDIVIREGVSFVQLTQVKTGKRVAIPINEQARRILDKRGGDFPRQISDVKFNLYIKKVCQTAGITQMVSGSKMDKKTGRKVKGVFPKYELITSHTCRRSFATNHYGIIPTGYLKDITAHSTERQFLEYVGKPLEDSAKQVAIYMEQLSQQRKNNPGHLKIV